MLIIYHLGPITLLGSAVSIKRKGRIQKYIASSFQSNKIKRMKKGKEFSSGFAQNTLKLEKTITTIDEQVMLVQYVRKIT